MTVKKLKSRFYAAVTIGGTLQYHAFILTQDRRLQLKKFSIATELGYFPKDKQRKSGKKVKLTVTEKNEGGKKGR